MTRILLLLSVAFLMAASWHIGSGMSAETMAFAVGVAFGAMAALPVAVLFFAALRRNDARQQQRRDIYRVARPAKPPVGYLETG